jgi:hypothetical protein
MSPVIVYNAESKQVTIAHEDSTQFDRSTMDRSKKFFMLYGESRGAAVMGFETGRYSARASLRAMAKALLDSCQCQYMLSQGDCVACEAINRVKVNGDWPLKEEPPKK